MTASTGETVLVVTESPTNLVVDETMYNLVVTAPGPQGAPGLGAHNLDTSVVQQIADTTWPVAHNLGYNPAGIVIQDHLGSTIEYDTLVYDDPNHLTLTFSAAISGTVWLS